MDEESVEVLNQRLAEARQPAAASAAAAAAAEEEAAARPSFLQSTDEELASALSSRISKVAANQAGDSGSAAADAEEAEAEGMLTGPLLRELMYEKWGKQYDVSFVRRDLPLGKTLICLNVRPCCGLGLGGVRGRALREHWPGRGGMGCCSRAYRGVKLAAAARAVAGCSWRALRRGPPGAAQTDRRRLIDTWCLRPTPHHTTPRPARRSCGSAWSSAASR